MFKVVNCQPAPSVSIPLKSGHIVVYEMFSEVLNIKGLVSIPLKSGHIVMLKKYLKKIRVFVSIPLKSGHIVIGEVVQQALDFNVFQSP